MSHEARVSTDVNFYPKLKQLSTDSTSYFSHTNRFSRLVASSLYIHSTCHHPYQLPKLYGREATTVKIPQPTEQGAPFCTHRCPWVELVIQSQRPSLLSSTILHLLLQKTTESIQHGGFGEHPGTPQSSPFTLTENQRQQESYQNSNGEFVRKDSTFRNFISKEPGAKFAPEKDRYALYANYGCPWVRLFSCLARCSPGS